MLPLSELSSQHYFPIAIWQSKSRCPLVSTADWSRPHSTLSIFWDFLKGTQVPQTSAGKIIKSHLPLLSNGFVCQGPGYFCITTMSRKGNRFKISHWHEFGIEYPIWKSHANLSKLNQLSWKGLVRRMRMTAFIRKHVLKFLERGLCWFRAVLLRFAPPGKGN